MLAPTRGRRRSLDCNKKRLLCDAVARGATMTEAAVTVGVSLRTVQREARLDPDFDQELRIAHTDKPDPLAMMQSAARTHWRAAAWLLERTNPEDYGRRPASSCTPFQFEEALKVVVETALRLAPPDDRAQVYAELSTASETAFKAVFPNYGPSGRRLIERLPATPLTDAQRLEVLRNPPPDLVVPDRIDAPPQVGWVDRAAATHQDETSQQRWVPAPRRTHPTDGDGLAANGAPHSQPIQHPEPEPNPTPAQTRRPSPKHTSDSRLPWQYNLRVARTSPIVPSAPNSASITPSPILSHLSPKTDPATEFTHDDNSPPTPPHSATATKAVE